APSPASLRGVVIGVHKGTLLVTSSSGIVRAIPGHVRVGTRISLAGGKLTVLGRAHRALIKGVVLRRHGNLTFFSVAHRVVLVHARARSLASAREDRPAPGTLVQANVRIDDQGELEEENEHVIGQEAEVEVQAVVSAVAAGSVTLTVNGQLFVIPLPVGLTLPTSIIGTQVTLKVEFDEGNARVAADDEDEDDDDHVVTTPAMTTATLPTRHDDGDRGGSDGRDGHDGGSGRD